MSDPMAHRDHFLMLLKQTRVYAVTDDALDSRKLIKATEAALAAGVRVVQYRDKRRSDRDRTELARRLAEQVHAWEGLLIVNDRADIALASGADGVHLGQEDLPLAAGRKLLGQQAILGASASFLKEIEPAVQAGADYLGFGAAFATDTKPDAEYAGLDLLERACEIAPIPVVAIGGITLERVPSVLERGAAAIAVVSALFRAEDPGQAARALLSVARRGGTSL
jgi:thiamine-phosphate pyrophosphorylase